MAGGYLVLIGDTPVAAAPRGTGAALARLGWRPAASPVAWARVWLRGVRPPPVACQAGVLTLGDVFPRRAPAAVGPGDGPTVFRDLCGGGWGAYAAVAWDGVEAWLFRDPSGGREALAWRAPGVTLVSDSLEHLPLEIAPQVSVDWDAAADFVRRAMSGAARSGLQGVTAPAAGEAVALRSGAKVQVWRPAALAAAPGVADPGRALREGLDEVCAAWTGAYGSLLAEVSGGFDSALVAASACAAPAGARVQGAIHYYGDRREGDERRWAVLAAARAGLRLHAIAKPDTPLTEADFAATASGARPSYAALDPARDRHTAAEAERLGIAAILTGYGGDALFYQMPSALPVADYLAEPGWRTVADRFPIAMARWLRRSLWRVAWDAARGGAALDSISYLSRFFGPRIRDTRPVGPAHPWLGGAEALLPGKRLQLAHLTASQLAHGPSRRGAVADILYPLLAQPLMEAALAIPSWRLVQGGRDRALARQVFADRLPGEIAQRRSKGMLTSYYARQVAGSLKVLRPYLLDGLLAGQGILDRAAVAGALHPDALIRRGDGIALVNAATVEAWARRWSA